MTLNQVYKAFALLGMIGAIIQIGSITYAYFDTDTTVPRTINTFALIFIIFGIIVSYLVQYKQLGWFGLIGFIVVFIGLLLIVGLSWGEAFARPVIEDLDPSLIAIKGSKSPDLPSPLAEGTVISFFTFNIGLILYSIALLKSSTLARWAGILFLLGLIGNFVPPDDDKGLYFLNAAVLWIGWKVWTRKAEA
ncbi:NADH-quinone oxidoreductase subunit A [Cohnella endophytica]|uniref:NADH-quinone oxidoreductase subunit A n=1 Tax=Cohnella endophytica TaxID=2419778 RepID=A0A494XAU9_9BACL|nr:NADH-quinone oxidoreductase subunit A [Cohnella endophytica]RKP47885.1 NADH-quinone oxidoreductase subunit A [Cohnella endophytica]